MATLIIILLTLVAVGIIWVVIKGVVTSGTNQISVTSECTAINLNAVSVNESSPGIYDVTLHRSSGGDNTLAGIKVNIFNDTTSSGPMDFGTLNLLDQHTVSLNTSTATLVTGGNRIEYTPFFKDSSGNEQLCSGTQSFSF